MKCLRPPCRRFPLMKHFLCSSWVSAPLASQVGAACSACACGTVWERRFRRLRACAAGLELGRSVGVCAPRPESERQDATEGPSYATAEKYRSRPDCCSRQSRLHVRGVSWEGAVSRRLISEALSRILVSCAIGSSIVFGGCPAHPMCMRSPCPHSCPHS